MVAQIFDVIGQTVYNFTQTLVSAINGLVPVVYDSTTGPTFVGTLLLIAIGMGIIYWVFRLLRGLMSGCYR